MATTHAPVNWFAGDDWQINATLLDENGNPFNLTTPARVLWALLNSMGQRVLDETDVVISVPIPTNGKCTIVVPSAKTSPLGTSQYNDVIRVVVGGMTSTVATGMINVAANPWIAKEATKSQPALRVVGR